ncbi:MAG: HAD family hydrolase [Spirochaetales bacterium]|jgi:FMN phosphatase YigB (HAD superfamily)|nr:HAD family hydrolase [Spirochaetales bacterium]
MKYFSLPRNVQGLIFDIDNTLYRNDRYCALQVELLIGRYSEKAGIPLKEAERRVADIRRRYAEVNNGSTTSTGNAMLELGVSLKENITWRNELFHPEVHLSPDPLLKEALTQLADEYAIVLVTNNTVQIGADTLAALGIEGISGKIVGLDTCLKSKPSKEPFIKALELCGMPAGRMISVGDRFDVDVAVPLSLGMGGILIEGMQDIYKLPAFLRG